MDTARLFQSGHSQTVRLPKEYRFAGTEVVVKHFGNGVLLLPGQPWQTLQAGLDALNPATSPASSPKNSNAQPSKRVQRSTMILLDTNICIYIINARPPAVLAPVSAIPHGRHWDMQRGSGQSWPLAWPKAARPATARRWRCFWHRSPSCCRLTTPPCGPYGDLRATLERSGTPSAR